MVLGVGVATLAAWFVWFGIGRVSVYETSQQARLEADAAPREISSLQSGRLVASQLQIGRAVRAGEILAELDASAETLRLREEQERVRLNPGKIEALRNQMSALRLAAGNDRRSAEAAIEAAEARLREATAAAEFANDNARRMRTESENGGIAEIDALRAASDASKLLAQRDALSAETRKLGLDAESRTRESEARIEELNRTLATLESDTEAARALVSRLKLEIENYRVRAPVDGIVGETQALAPGAFVAQGQKLAKIGRAHV